MIDVDHLVKVLKFSDTPDFTPMLTPREMLELGVFGGIYFNRPEWREDIDPTVFEDLDPCLYSVPDKQYATKTNLFKTKAGQDQVDWEIAGWIHRQDPRGWFQWYCRFYSGRRTADDKRQIGRWKSIFRHQRGLQTRLAGLGKKLSDSYDVLPRFNRANQTILHWAWLPHIDYARRQELPTKQII